MNKFDYATNVTTKSDKLTDKNTAKLDNCRMKEHSQGIGANYSR